ncbi:MAG: hypothetical protein HC862_03580 [Scytonema sp. RU_4_4]|nr:hypothetical protein [Scytonema sp. RU_4_4]
MAKFHWRKCLQQVRAWLLAIRASVWLALLTFFLVTVGVPIRAIDGHLAFPWRIVQWLRASNLRLSQSP